MAYMHRCLRYVAALALSFACDSGYDLYVTVTISEDIAAAYNQEQRGLLLVDVRSEGLEPLLRTVAVLCGEAGSYTVNSPGDGEVPNTTITAWIEPVTGGACGPLENWGESNKYYVDKEEPQARTTVEEAGACNRNAAVELILTVL